MHLGLVTGSVVATTRVSCMEGMRLLLVSPVAEDGSPNGSAIVAADATGQAGVGHEVYYVASREAAVAMDPWFVPVDHAIVGIVDQIDHPDRSA